MVRGGERMGAGPRAGSIALLTLGIFPARGSFLLTPGLHCGIISGVSKERAKEHKMTATDITAGATYTVHFEHGKLSHKRFNDAVALVRGIGRYEGSSADYDTATRTWTVTLDPEANRALADLQNAVDAYGAIAERA